MVASVLMSLVVLAAPTDEEAAKLLRVAWASQYEWKEDGVKNATINFNFEEIRTAGSDDFASGGKGTVVFANGEIARIHAPGVGWRRKVLVEELTWVFQRFARKPFEERFKDAEFKKPEKAAGDTTKIASTKAWGYFLKEGRIVGLEYNIGKGKKPFIVRVDYKPTDMRDGYGLLSEFSSFTMAGVKTVSTRELELRRTDDAPSPKTFVKTTLMAGTKVVFKIEFELPQLNEENPVVLDTVARDALREAWQRRWVLPDDIRLDGMFQRKPDRDLGKAGWMDVSGDFQVWGMNDIKTAVDVKKFRRAGGQVAETCQNQIREGFGRFKATPFDAEFKGCGFTREESKDGKAAVIRLFGYEKAIAFRVQDGAINGVLTKVQDDEGWWRFKLKKGPNDLMLLEKMTRKINDKKIDLRFKFTKKKGQLVPSRLDAFGVSDRGPIGVVTYNLKRVKLTPANG